MVTVRLSTHYPSDDGAFLNAAYPQTIKVCGFAAEIFIKKYLPFVQRFAIIAINQQRSFCSQFFSFPDLRACSARLLAVGMRNPAAFFVDNIFVNCNIISE